MSKKQKKADPFRAFLHKNGYLKNVQAQYYHIREKSKTSGEGAFARKVFMLLADNNIVELQKEAIKIVRFMDENFKKEIVQEVDNNIVENNPTE